MFHGETRIVLIDTTPAFKGRTLTPCSAVDGNRRRLHWPSRPPARFALRGAHVVVLEAGWSPPRRPAQRGHVNNGLAVDLRHRRGARVARARGWYRA